MPIELGSPRALGNQLREKAIRKISCVVALLLSDEETIDKRIHETRKAVKRLRAVLRALGTTISGSDFAVIDASLADVGRQLAPLRAARAISDTLVMVNRGFAHDQPELAERMSQALLQHSANVKQQSCLPDRLQGACDALLATSDRISLLKTESCSWSVVSFALTNTYRQARRRFRKALRTDDAEDFHASRRATKHHLHHLELLRPMWPEILEAEAEKAHDLADILGEDHDLADLKALIPELPMELESDEHQVVHRAIEIAVRKRRDRAEPIAARLFAESARAWEARHTAYFTAWRAESKE